MNETRYFYPGYKQILMAPQGKHLAEKIRPGRAFMIRMF